MTRQAIRQALRCLLPALLLAVAASGSANTPTSLDELVAAGKLELGASLHPAGPLVPGQKLTLTLTIATDSWFSGGTRITLPEVAGLVILQTEQFASNASERRAGNSWVVQRWNLDIYPQRAGDFTLPPIASRLQVNAGEAGNVAGTLESAPLNFTVRIPPGLEGLEHWVAAPAFRVEQRFDKELEGLQVGDAFEREIVFEASDVMAMMLPTFNAGEVDGLAVYPLPPLLDNSNNRGQTEASRRERTSYVVQAQGHYLLPALDYYWWDTAAAKLRVLSLPATEFSVGAGAVAANGEATTSTLGIPWRQWLLWGTALALGLLALWTVRHLLRRFPLTPLTATLRRWWQTLQNLRKPGLPASLNPGSNAGE